MTTLSTRSRLACIVALAVLLPPALAHATGSTPKDPSPATSTSTSSAGANSESNAGALSAAGAVAGGGSAQAAGGAGGAGGESSAAQRQRAEATGGSGVGTVEGDVSAYKSSALALSIPAATAAPAVISECIEHSRGWQAGMGVAARTGGTKLQEKCMDRQHCLAVADRYHSMGLLQAAVDQLATCGGVPGVTVVLPPSADPAAKIPAPAVVSAPLAPSAAVASPQDLVALEQRINDRLDRQFRTGLSK